MTENHIKNFKPITVPENSSFASTAKQRKISFEVGEVGDSPTRFVRLKGYFICNGVLHQIISGKAEFIWKILVHMFLVVFLGSF